LNELPDQLGMQKIIQPYVVCWKDQWSQNSGKHNGWSGFVMIAESHISIHTFVEEGYITADVYSCKSFDTKKALDYFKSAFGIQEMETHVIHRGQKYERVLAQIHKKLSSKK
jgi:S-adenosylmethionine decarboxylase